MVCVGEALGISYSNQEMWSPVLGGWPVMAGHSWGPLGCGWPAALAVCFGCFIKFNLIPQNLFHFGSRSRDLRQGLNLLVFVSLAEDSNPSETFGAWSKIWGVRENRSYPVSEPALTAMSMDLLLAWRCTSIRRRWRNFPMKQRSTKAVFGT